jgi:aldehyde dehydrogenase (NAD+)/phenylacetaldehyde dehydrogenase
MLTGTPVTAVGPHRSAGAIVDARSGHFIDGRWSAPIQGRTRQVVSPATNETIAEVAAGTIEDADAAVAAARRAFDDGPWPRMSASERGRYLLRMAALLEQHADEVARIESLNNGKPIRESRHIDVPLSVDCLEYFAGFPTKITGETLPVPGDVLAYTRREPVGIVGAITPFNFPLLLATWKIAPALACGNTIVVKPSSDTPLSTLRLAEIADEAGLPPGVLNVVIADSVAGMRIVEHPDVDKVTFTGSTAVGKEIARAAAGDLKRVSLELGGKAPNIVFADAPLDDAVAGALFGVYWTQGEICTAGSRIYVERPCYERFVEAFVARARALRVGDPLDWSTQIGPIVSRGQCERVLGYIEAGRNAGARILAGGGPPDDPALAAGNYISPTVFVAATPDMSIVREEIFGPVAVILPFDSESEAIRVANDTEYGLTAGVWTSDVKRAHRVASAIRAGTVWVNMYNVVTSEAPFGGYKESGWGRENGPHAIEAFTEVKHVYVNLADRSTDWFGSEG